MSLILNGTTGISDVDGTAAAPALTGTDSNTGIFFPAADTIAFSEGGAEAMRIDSSGNVGIGTNSPSSWGKFAVQGTAAGSQVVSAIVNQSGTASSQAVLSFDAGANGFNSRDSQIRATNNGLNQTTLEFYTANGSTPAERMRIDSSGNLLVGTTSVPSTGAGTNSTIVSNKDYSGAFAQIINSSSTSGTQSFIQFGRGSSECGKITSTGTNSTTYATSSDYRLKHDIVPMTGALAKIAALKPVTYKWKSDNSGSEGFIAHQLAEVVPDAVVGEKDAYNEDGSIKPQGIDTSFLVATLTAAIQEQQALITALTARIAALEGAA